MTTLNFLNYTMKYMYLQYFVMYVKSLDDVFYQSIYFCPGSFSKRMKGEREPSYQTVCYIAQIFHCNVDFLYGISDKMEADYVIVSASETPELYELVKLLQEKRGLETRLLAYARKLFN